MQIANIIDYMLNNRLQSLYFKFPFQLFAQADILTYTQHTSLGLIQIHKDGEFFHKII